MRLINAETLDLEEFYGEQIPNYAILSHTWGDGEVSYQDWQYSRHEASKKSGYSKIISTCQQALKNGLHYAWVDTNCIDKSSSAELSEAINSMFAWYRDATICYAYLSDVSYVPRVSLELPERQFRKSRWFTRGWTLQELMAPFEVEFYSAEWHFLGGKQAFRVLISDITGIGVGPLGDIDMIFKASIAKRMYWLSRRTTTRVEDMAYCMLGIFNINMPLLYGEGVKSFVRLQEEIIKVSMDHTIFCWTWTNRVHDEWTSLLAPLPETFKYSEAFEPVDSSTSQPYSMTNAGLSIQLSSISAWKYSFIALNVRHRLWDNGDLRICIPVMIETDASLQDSSMPSLYRRIPCPVTIPLVISISWALPQKHLFVKSLIPTRMLKSTRDFSSQEELQQRAESQHPCFLLSIEPKLRRLKHYASCPLGTFDSDYGVFRLSPVSVDNRDFKLFCGILVFRNFMMSISARLFLGKPFELFCQILPYNSGAFEKRKLIAQLTTSALLERRQILQSNCPREEVHIRLERYLWVSGRRSEDNISLARLATGSLPMEIPSRRD